MSSSDLTTPCPVSLPKFSVTTSSDGDTETNFAQTKEPFDIDSYSEPENSEDDIKINTTKNNPSHPTSNDFQSQIQSQIQISELAEPPTSPHTFSTSSEFSDPTTDDLIQYASDISLFAVNPDIDSHHEHFLTKSNHEMQDLAKLRDVITRKPVGFRRLRDMDVSTSGVHDQVRDFGAEVARPNRVIDFMRSLSLLSAEIQVREFVTRLRLKVPFARVSLVSRSPRMKMRDFEAQPPRGTVRARGSLAGISRKIEDFPECVIRPVVEQDEFEPIGRYGPVQRARTDDAFQSSALPQHRNDASVVPALSSNTVDPRSPLAGTSLRVGGLLAWVLNPAAEQDEFKLFGGFQQVEIFQSVDEYQNVNASQPQSLTTPQKHTQATPLGTISNKSQITKSSPLNLLNHALYQNYPNIINGEKPEWKISSSAAEELFPASSDEESSLMEEEQNNTLEPPPAPVLGNLSTPDLSVMDLNLDLDLDLQDDVRSVFRVSSRRAKKSGSSLKYSRGEEMNEQSIIAISTGEVSENSTSLTIQSVVALPSPLTLSERLSLEPRIFRLLSHSLHASPYHPAEIAQRIDTNSNCHLDVWPTIALALGIPILPSHLLTPSSLQALGTISKLVELEEGYLSDELHQWALGQHQIFLWINSGALEDGIDGIFEEPRIGSQGQGFDEDCDGADSEDSILWDYEDVEAFARSEIVRFRRGLEWIQDVDVDVDVHLDVEGEEGTVCTLPDEVYNFCGDEEIIHRSVSEPVEESEGCSAVLKEYYEMKRNAGGESNLSLSSSQSLIHRIRKSVVLWASANY
ncbi:3342db36-4ca8-4885-a809-393febe8fe66 [Sclerotinia trifoliorum]|uniref:3342db36-4ca8-4885-a809-393febe8fe66 n=1 Tax=Sclerotinia trifoliorum TaxID=28548 RepID=A0A8H2W314_9HELO|nr:3342db36-4ca8-4885-a809-393febe8fe66 [Sclerotinia trifoliorum]